MLRAFGFFALSVALVPVGFLFFPILKGLLLLLIPYIILVKVSLDPFQVVELALEVL